MIAKFLFMRYNAYKQIKLAEFELFSFLPNSYKEVATMTKNIKLLQWVDEMAALTKPEKVVWIDGSEEQLEGLRKEAMATGELIKLNE